MSILVAIPLMLCLAGAAYTFGRMHQRTISPAITGALTWACPECGTRGSAPTMSGMELLWRVHDNETTCSTCWSV
jgi:hypothetical protein